MEGEKKESFEAEGYRVKEIYENKKYGGIDNDLKIQKKNEFS